MPRSYSNNWHDAMMGEIELGSSEAYLAMACDERFSDEQNRSYDHGLSTMEIWFVFENDDRIERGEPPTNETPWGPMYDPAEFARMEWGPPTEEELEVARWASATDEELEEDEERACRQVEWEEDQELDRLLRKRPSAREEGDRHVSA